ncbi:penicillin binding protein [Gracilibacillus halophilus YIM-C55.5]|uniref:serine-type D-Ala-D-Ala carboxypeptidase n=1 Tax=Gracilibacillus halophilus YIM-C55.5 TaxID=1308866 RepID=N4WDN1_9BACI|nr:penicillin-binding transpeptidase domain-containing protein [Gracilibacillus halophilus]ENH98378.1 penicillin binding protein [Gracilibacillus halophilus YIM-C55.5]
MKKIVFICIGLFLLLVGCSNDEEVQPEERLQEYTDHWKSQDFESMYEMVQDVEKERFVDRYQKIYNDIGVRNLSVSFETPDSENTDNEDKQKKTFPLTVEMETLAGPISFESNIEMVKQEETVDGESKVDWLVNWHPGLIFPELENGADVGMETVQPVRGEIFDRNGEGLAVNGSVYELGVVQDYFSEENADQEKQEIADILDITVEDIDQALNQNWVRPTDFVPLKVVQNLEENDLAEAVDAMRPLLSQTTTERLYPYSEVTAHLTGYIAPITAEKLEEVDETIYSENDMIGQRGLEELFEERLRGEEGVRLYAEKDDDEIATIAEKEVQNGEDITLTIDINVQERLFTSLEGDAGTATAIHPTTGDTLALVSSPAFDPNAFIFGLSQDQWNEWQEDPQNPLLNRFASTFAPGSAFKPITSAIGLTDGSLDPDAGRSIEGLTWQQDDWGNYEVTRVSESSGPVDLTDALVRSDNIYFAQTGLEIGSETMMTGLKNFGFDEEIPFTYPLPTSTISSDGSLDDEVLLADTSYGQGELQMSALHLAASYSIFLNEGNLVQPILEKDEDGGTWKENLISNDHAAIIRDALRKVMTEGTGSSANISSVEISGKTGTAELKQSQDVEDGEENGWFVGYPDGHSMIISMMVENIEGQDHGSAYVAEKVTQSIADLE